MSTMVAPATPVTTGLEHVLTYGDGRLDGLRIGLATHAAAVLPDLRHGLDALLAAGVNLRAVFGPEHGFRGSAQAGAAESSTLDPDTGVTIYDTYTVTGPALVDLLRTAEIDLLIVDLQHVGARFYTYESTLFDLIEAARPAGVRVLVLDRPNPVGGRAVQGPVLDPGYSSFVGRAPIPLRHGMTMGELALLFADLIGAERPEVIPMRGWQRAGHFAGTGLPWVPPSPNIPTPSTALCYPGMCLLEGTNLTLGRGTTNPFELCGAPWLDGSLARELRTLDLPGVMFREASFTPTFDRHAGDRVSGIQLHIGDPYAFDSLATTVTMLTVILKHWSQELKFHEPTFDRLAGGDRLRRRLLERVPPADLVAEWDSELAAFRELREAYLLYPDLDESAADPAQHANPGDQR